MSEHATVEQLSALVDGELGLVAREAVSAHLRECPACAALHEQLVDVAAPLQALGPETWSDELTAAVGAALWQVEPPVAARRERDWSLPIAAALAVAGIGAVGLVSPVVLSSAFDALRFNVFSTLAQGAGVPVAAFLVVLLLLPALGLLALPLVRRR